MIKSVILPDGNKFIGEFCNGKRNGLGVKFYPNGAVYKGMWHNDIRHGAGIKVHADGTEVAVEYINGKRAEKQKWN